MQYGNTYFRECKNDHPKTRGRLTSNDVQMGEGFVYDTLLKIGFLNTEPEKYIEYYRNVYNIIILHDGSLQPVNAILQQIISTV